MPNKPQTGLDDETVLGLDNIPLRLPVAGVGSRVLAGGIDYLALVLLVVGVMLGIVLLAGRAGLEGGWFIALLIATPFVLDWSYFTIQEIAGRGRTLGKRAVGLRVVGRHGGEVGPWAIVIRNLLRDIDLFLAVPMISIDPLCRRLGDRVAGTLVVHDRPPASELILGRIPDRWGAEEVAIVESFFRRADALDRDRANAMAGRLLWLVERDAPEFLDGIAPATPPQTALWRALDVRTDAVSGR